MERRRKPSKNMKFDEVPGMESVTTAAAVKSENQNIPKSDAEYDENRIESNSDSEDDCPETSVIPPSTVYDPLEIEVIKIKEEFEDDMVVDLFDANLKSCGEILFLDKYNFVYVCTFCMMRFKKHIPFITHLQNSHLKTVSVAESLADDDDIGLDFNDIKEEKPGNTYVQPLELNNDSLNDSSQGEDFDFGNDTSDSGQDEPEPESNNAETISISRNQVNEDELLDKSTSKSATRKPRKKREKQSSNNLPDQFPCKICNKIFKSKNYLKIHLELHTDNGSYKCDSCGAEFTKRYNLQQHMHRHRQEKHFPCTQCDKVFRTKLGLTLHFRTHTGERPYICDTCGVSFVSINGLKDHKAVHENLRQFKCDICFKGFNQKRSLTEHRKSVHATEKNFICSTCGSAYPSNTNLRKHQKIHAKHAAKNSS